MDLGVLFWEVMRRLSVRFRVGVGVGVEMGRSRWIRLGDLGVGVGVVVVRFEFVDCVVLFWLSTWESQLDSDSGQ